MSLDYLDIVSLMHPHSLSNEELQQLIHEILENELNRYSACAALISHGDRVRHEICKLLQSDNDNIVFIINV